MQIVGPTAGRAAVLRFTKPTTAALVAATTDAGPGARWAVRRLTVEVAAPAKGFVFDIGGHGVQLEAVAVTMPHDLSSAASVVHTHGTGFSVTGALPDADDTSYLFVRSGSAALSSRQFEARS